MKTAKEWFDIMITGSPDIKEVISEIQREAYNQALEDAVNSVKVMNTKKLNFETGKWENVPLIDQTSILKLKK